MIFSSPPSFTIDVTQEDINASLQGASTNCLIKALQRSYDNLTGVYTNIGLSIVSGQLVAICNIALVNFVYVLDNVSALYVLTQQDIGVKPGAPFTATLTVAGNII